MSSNHYKLATADRKSDNYMKELNRADKETNPFYDSTSVASRPAQKIVNDIGKKISSSLSKPATQAQTDAIFKASYQAGKP
jgi:hypothetical protein